MIAYHHVYNLINNRGSGKVSDETKEPICILQEARGLIGFPLPERPRRLSTQSRLSSGGGGAASLFAASRLQRRERA